MKLSLASLAVLSLAFSSVSCSTEEQDGRQYYSPAGNPVQGRMGVQHRRLRTATPDGPRVSDGSLFGSANSNEPPGLLDRNEKPEEPGAEYWIHGQQSATPVQGRMGVQVSRRKK